MNPIVKRAALAVVAVIGLVVRLIPAGMRRRVLFALLVVESRTGAPDVALRRLFAIEDDLDLVIEERATALGGGEHPKYRLTRYADYFVGHIGDNDRVLDIGCGRGHVARAIARARPGARIVGIDIDAASIAVAQEAANPPNLSFVVGDATARIPDATFDVIVLSNVLEHLDRRPEFLRRIVAAASAKAILIRVPYFERDWRLPMRRELGVNHFSDPTHLIEYTLEEFTAEIAAGGLWLIEQQLRWGEIWALCHPAPAARQTPPGPEPSP